MLNVDDYVQNIFNRFGIGRMNRFKNMHEFTRDKNKYLDLVYTK